jgi:tripartite-type tricarboxylate transporter receptor subunit TctC
MFSKHSQDNVMSGMLSNFIRRTAGFAFGTILACSPLQALSAAEYPNQVIRIVVGFGAGGNIDTLARALADQLSKSLSAKIIVENRPGAGGNIAAAGVAKSTPDGHTILLGGTNYVIGPACAVSKRG